MIRNLELLLFVVYCALLLCKANKVFDCKNPRDGTEKHNKSCCASIRKKKIIPERPLRFVHIPKCGTTFLNTVYRLACDLPDYAAMRGDLRRAPHGMMALYFQRCFPKAHCHLEGGVQMNLGHKALSSDSFFPNKVAYITMLREPFERLVSGYDDHYHDCGKRCHGQDLLYYGKQIQGIYLKFLLGSAKMREMHYNASKLVPLAVSRLEQFTFVGILEEWDLSVCLCHALFGYRRGMPINAEFTAIRSSSKHNAITIQVRSKQLRQDAIERARKNYHSMALADRDIYNAAFQLFNRRLNQYHNRS